MRTEPWAHQRRELEGHCEDEARALIWSMRTGKTKAIVDQAFRLHDLGAIRAVLILAPNGVHLNWTLNEVPKHSWHGNYQACAWSSRLSREGNVHFGMDLCLAQARSHLNLKFLSVNSEALINERAQDAISVFLRKHEGRVMLVADECHDFRRPGSSRTALARALARRCSHRRILSGTPLLNSPLHAFSQFELLHKGALGFDKYSDFKRQYAEYEKEYGKGQRAYDRLVGYKNLDELRGRMAPMASVVLREDCGDMPDLVRTERPVELSDRQAEAYRDMVRELLIEVGNERVTAVSGGAKVLKLQQILGGFVLKPGGDVVSIDDEPPILDALEEQVVGAWPSKVVVWCRFQEDIRRVCARLDRMGTPRVQFHGRMPDGVREAELRKFQLFDGPMVLVGQPVAGGVGRDMSAADTIIWYTHVADAIITEQANERATARGGRRVDVVSLTNPGTVCDDIRRSNEAKVSLADVVTGRGLRDLLLRTRV